MNIRPARLDEVDRLVALHGLLQAHHETVEPALWRPSPDVAAQWGALHAGSIRSDDAAVFVAEEDGEVVGFLSGKVVVREAMTPRVVGLVDTAFIGDEWRGHGVGTALTARLLDFFQSRGVEEVSVRYVAGNRGAARFWEGFGFRPIICTANAPLSELRRGLAEREARAGDLPGAQKR